MKGSFVALIGTVLIAASSTEAFAQKHPNEQLFEYRIKNYTPQGPWYSLPTGKEKGDWECTDESTASINCSFIRTDLSEFQYIYKRKSTNSRNDLRLFTVPDYSKRCEPGTLC
jgi:hypothetical protein